MSITVDIRGIPELREKLAKIADIGTILQPPFERGMARIQAHLSQYPPLSNANVPSGSPPESWYQRGTGTIYARKRGGLTIRRTSQQLNRGWSVRRDFGSRIAEIELGNRVSYAPYVHLGSKQAGFHARRGWRTVEDTVRMFEPQLVSDCAQAIDQALRG